ncbi:therostasin-like [Saccostrea echinata]|uniref:therostasin-like n=1 Tax=Saccostrea echinata TaxID=191078 RepID=UPI002A832622|nr:therostasin-like [Saccostrea echinata]XP_061166628.1 therostasin-like [Saccostrea echinata]
MQSSGLLWIVSLTCFLIALGSLAEACPKQEPCPRRCPFRYKKDANGCRTCQCCPVLRCPFCWRGYIIGKEENQCMSCHCKWGL